MNYDVVINATGSVADLDAVPGVRSHVVAALAAAGVTIINGAQVAAVRPGCVQLADGRTVSAGAAVWAGPFMARPLARDSGLASDASGRMLVDAALRSISYPNVIVAGDAALARGGDGAPARMACATALPMGVAAGDTALAVAAGQEPAAFANRYFVQCLSLGRRDGLLQFVDPCDAPAPKVVTGRRAAWAKEVITRGTIWSLAALRRIPTIPLPGVLAAPPAAGGVPEGIRELVTGAQR